MRPRRWLPALALLVACGGGDSVCDRARPATPLDAATLGTINGTVTLQGPPPAMVTLRISGECAALHKEPVPVGDAIVQDGLVQSAFVYLKDGLGDRTFAVPATPVVIDQAGCIYRPHVAGAQTCQPVQFVNSDAFLHNVHGSPRLSSAWNFGMSVQGSRREVRIAKPEVMIGVRCDVHPWMQAWLGVLDHPFFAVTGADGRVALRGVPAGDYLVASWHERFGVREARVTLGAGETKEVAFGYGP